MRYFEVIVEVGGLGRVRLRAKNAKEAEEEVTRRYREGECKVEKPLVTIVNTEQVTKSGIPIYPIRKCSHCKKTMYEGYCIGGGEEYYCSDKCLYTRFTPEEWEELAAEDGDSYWTEWR